MEESVAGLSLVGAVVLLSGQMAGVGVLALPAAMLGTGTQHTVPSQRPSQPTSIVLSAILIVRFDYTYCNPPRQDPLASSYWSTSPATRCSWGGGWASAGCSCPPTSHKRSVLYLFLLALFVNILLM